MKTEEIHRRAIGADPHEVSRSLQELTPLWCSIADRRGRPVPLSAAGYVLRFGKSYRLRFLSPFQDEEHEVRIINPPAFVKAEAEIREVDEQGRLVRCIPFKVPLNLWSQMWRLGIGIHADELEVVHVPRAGMFRETPAFLCPVVARPVWITLFAAILLGCVGALVPRIVAELFLADSPHQRIIDSIQSVEKWLLVVALAFLIWFVVNLINLLLLYKRGRELRHGFREKYPPL